MESKVFHNDGTIDAPVPGNLLRTYKTDVTEDTRDMSGSKYQYHAQQTDAVTHETRSLVFDNANYYRKLSEIYAAQVAGKSLNIDTEYDYSPDFCGGEIPAKIRLSADNSPIEEATAVSFDSDSRKYVIRVRPLPAGVPEKMETLDLNLSE
jgi:hypothetical protein